MKLIIIFLLSFILLSFVTWKTKIFRPEPPPISSLFYQPLLIDKIDWNSTFKDMKECHIETLILQWSKFGVVDFMKSEAWLHEILSQAQKYQIKVTIGLYGDDYYFKKLESKKTDVAAYFQELLQVNTLQAKKIYTIAKHYKAFKGWYIYDEIDDTHFITQKRELLLKNYLQSLADNLNNISPHPLYISGYFSNNMKPIKYANMFSNITQKRYTILLQSGIGANLVNHQESSNYMKVFQKHFQGNFIPIIEGFKSQDSKIIAIDFKTLKKQIDIIVKSSGKEKVALFSLRYFLTKELISSYKKHYSSNDGAETN